MASAKPRKQGTSSILREQRNRGRAQDPDTQEEGAIQEFFGQLWLVPSSPKSSARSREEAKAAQEGLVWIRKDRWESNSFTPDDCFPVRGGDTLGKSPTRLDFAGRIWGEGERASFAQVVKNSMANRGRGGRGPRPRPDGEWSGWGPGTGTSTLLHIRRRRLSSSRRRRTATILPTPQPNIHHSTKHTTNKVPDREDNSREGGEEDPHINSSLKSRTRLVI